MTEPPPPPFPSYKFAIYELEFVSILNSCNITNQLQSPKYDMLLCKGVDENKIQQKGTKDTHQNDHT